MKYSNINLHFARDKALLGVSLIDHTYNTLNNLNPNHEIFISSYDILKSAYTFDVVNYILDGRLAFSNFANKPNVIAPIILDEKFSRTSAFVKYDVCTSIIYDFDFCPSGVVSKESFKLTPQLVASNSDKTEMLFEDNKIVGTEFPYVTEHLKALSKILSEFKSFDIPSCLDLVNRNIDRFNDIKESMRGSANVTLESLSILKSYMSNLCMKHILALEYTDLDWDDLHLSASDLLSKSLRKDFEFMIDPNSNHSEYRRLNISDDSNSEDRKIYGSMACRLRVPYYINVMTNDGQTTARVFNRSGYSRDEDEESVSGMDPEVMDNTIDNILSDLRANRTKEFEKTSYFEEPINHGMSLSSIEDDIEETYVEPVLNIKDFIKKQPGSHDDIKENYMDIQNDIDSRGNISEFASNIMKPTKHMKNFISAPLDVMAERSNKSYTLKEFMNKVKYEYIVEKSPVSPMPGVVSSTPVGELIVNDTTMFKVFNKIPNYMQYFKYWDAETAKYQDEIMGVDDNNTIPLTFSEKCWLNEMNQLAVDITAAENCILRYDEALALSQKKIPVALERVMQTAIKHVLFISRSFTGFNPVNSSNSTNDIETIVVNPAMYKISEDGTVKIVGNSMPRQGMTLYSKFMTYLKENYCGPATFAYALIKLLRDGSELKPTIFIMNHSEIPYSSTESVADKRLNFDLNFNSVTHSVGVTSDIKFSDEYYIDMVILATNNKNGETYFWPTPSYSCKLKPNIPIGFRIYTKAVIENSSDIRNTTVNKYEYVTIFELVRRLMSTSRKDRIRSISGISYSGGKFKCSSRDPIRAFWNNPITDFSEFQQADYGYVTLDKIADWVNSATWKSATIRRDNILYGIHHLCESKYLDEVKRSVESAIGCTDEVIYSANEFKFLKDSLHAIKYELRDMIRIISQASETNDARVLSKEQQEKLFSTFMKNILVQRYFTLFKEVEAKGVDPILDLLKYIQIASYVYINSNKQMVGEVPPIEECIKRSEAWVRLNIWNGNERLVAAYFGKVTINGNEFGIVVENINETSNLVTLLSNRIRELRRGSMMDKNRVVFLEKEFVDWYRESYNAGHFDISNTRLIWARPTTKGNLDIIYQALRNGDK